MLAAMHKELHARVGELSGGVVKSIYFGGGTPSLLSGQEIQSFIEAVSAMTELSKDAEITLEANPDDLMSEKLQELAQTKVNRLSIGVQSFFTVDLKWMNRAHHAEQAKESIQLAQQHGFKNITIDLIYGSPTTTNEHWQENLKIWHELNLPHLSAYCLTVEQNTALHHAIKKGLTQPPKEKKAVEQFEILLDFCAHHEIDAYEISNYAKDGNHAKHNSTYWFGKPYVGIGPSAHSFDGNNIRRWNVANNQKYIKSIAEHQQYWDEETLNENDRINEYLMTRLRTKWGITKSDFVNQFGDGKWPLVANEFERLVREKVVVEQDENYVLSRKGKFVADHVIRTLLLVS